MKTCVILEGGGLRGIYSAGVLDEMIKDNPKIHTMIGVSMGALVGVNYLSNQPQRALRYNLKYCHHPKYMSLLSLLFTGNIANKEFAYYKIPNQLDKFDNKTYKKSKIKFYATLTNIETGEAEYFPIKDAKKEIEILRASSSMPGVSKIVKIKRKKYLDGGISDSIPLQKALNEKFDRIVLILTREKSYEKKQKISRFLKIKYRKYPNLLDALEKRAAKYNETLKQIKKLEKEKKIFVIRPSEKLKINRIEHKRKRIQAQYDLGVKDYLSKKKSLLKYLNK